MNLKNYLKYSSVLALFSEAIQFHYIIDLKLFYFIIIFNSLLLSINSIRLNKNHIILLILITIHGFIGVVIFRYPITSLVSQLIGISILSIYFYNLIRFINYKELFNTYANFSFYICILGLLMFYSNITVWDPNRLHSILNEPSRFVIIVLPSIYYFFKIKKYFKFSVIFISIILAQSSIGYIGLLLFLILPNLKVKVFKKLAFLIPIFIVAGYFLSQNEYFQRRYTQTMESLSVFRTGKFSEAQINISSYALLSNAYTSFNNFIDHPLGSGLGSFKSVYEVYIKELEIPGYLIKLKQDDINSEDANSLFLRMLSDFGIFGLVIMLYFVYLCFRVFKYNSIESLIAQSLVVYFLLKLLRQGHYFPQEFYFFLWVFIFAYIESKKLEKLENK